jgi:hypothetical protein
MGIGNGNMTCTYKQEYYDYQILKFEIFPCDQECTKNKKFCLFHDDTHLKDPENNDNVIAKLYHRIDKSISKNEPLLCIGYYLPDVLINREFKQPVYFNHSKFHDAYFTGSTFSDRADFSGTTFSGPAIFTGTTFSNKTRFSGEFRDNIF